MDPQLASAFSNSTHFSRKYRIQLTTSDSRGSGAHLLKDGSKRRRTKQQIADDKERAAQEKLDIEQKLQRVAELEALQAERDQLRAEKANFQRIAKANAEQAEVHRQMKAAGLIGLAADGTWGISNGQNLVSVAAESKAKAQLLGVEKRE